MTPPPIIPILAGVTIIQPPFHLPFTGGPMGNLAWTGLVIICGVALLRFFSNRRAPPRGNDDQALRDLERLIQRLEKRVENLEAILGREERK